VPRRPLRPCRVPGCAGLVTSGYCAHHKGGVYDRDAVARREADDRKGELRQFYSSPPWRKLRARVLREEPFCACGCGERTDTVDHIKSAREHPELRLMRSNLRAWFGDCHNRKTATFDGGWGNAKRAQQATG
jgi:5-methylcytosine-specific restriction protein A